MSKKDYCFTINNAFGDAAAVESHLLNHPNLFALHDNVTLYSIFQLESGSQGTVHVQGYVEFQHEVGLKQLKREISPQAHWERRYGTREKARDYCRKPNTRVAGPWEFGSWRDRVQGIGGGLQAVITGLKQGDSLDQCIDRDPEVYIRYRGGIERYAQRCLRGLSRAKRQLRIFWYYGPTGTGKSGKLFTTPGWEGGFVKDNTKWWNDYEGQSVVLWDEFDGTTDFRLALRWFDCWPCIVENKGGSVPLVFTTIAVSSVRHPASYYVDEHGEWRRRICGGTIVKLNAVDELGDVSNRNTEGLATWDREKMNASDGFFRMGGF